MIWYYGKLEPRPGASSPERLVVGCWLVDLNDARRLGLRAGMPVRFMPTQDGMFASNVELVLAGVGR